MHLLDIVKKGSVDRSIAVRIIDSTDGTPETGVAYNTSGIALWYRREGGAKVAMTLVTLALLTTAHTDNGFLTVGDGEYRLDLPDAAWATGANYVDFGGTVTGMIVIGGRVYATDIDLEDTVRAGLTALPNAAANATGGLPIVDSTGAVKIQSVMKKNTALAKFAFLMTDSTTHNPATGKTVTVTRSIDGGAFGATTAGTATELSNGVYLIDLSAADRNGNVVMLRCVASSGCDELYILLTMEP